MATPTSRKSCIWFAWKFHFRFGLRTMFIGVMVISVILGWASIRQRRYQEDVRRIEEISGIVTYTRDASKKKNPFALKNPKLTLWDGFFPPEVDSVSFWKNDRAWTVTPEISRLAGVHSIQFSDTPLRDSDLEPLAKLEELVALDLSRTLISSEGVRTLIKCNHLEYLAFNETNVDDAGIACIADLSRLKYLSIDDTDVTDDGIKSLRRCKRLEMLSVCGTAVTDECLSSISKMENLKFLVVWRTVLTRDELLAGLNSLRSLETVWYDRQMNPNGVLIPYHFQQSREAADCVKLAE